VSTKPVIRSTFASLIPRNVILGEKTQENWLVLLLELPKNVYILDAKLNEECHMNLVDESWVWNRRLGHIKFDNLVKFNNLGAVRNLPKIINPPNTTCRHCQLRKQTSIRFKAKEYTTSKPLELVHIDLCGPTRTKSLQ
jgi:hypothetical protein